MIDILLNAAKMVLSPDARKTVTDIVDVLKRTPEWQKEICQLELRVTKSKSEVAFLVRDLAANKMQDLGYPRRQLQAFLACYTELLNNVLEHGCKRQDQVFKIIIDVSQSYVSLTVLNPPWSRFDLDNALVRMRQHPEEATTRRRGRGLLMVSQLADSVQAIPRKGVKCIMYRATPCLNVKVVDGLAVAVLSDTSGLNVPTLPVRLTEGIKDYTHLDILLDVRLLKEHCSTALLTYVIDLRNMLSRVSRKLILLANNSKDGIELGDEVIYFQIPEDMISYSLDDALKRLSRTRSRSKIVKAIEQCTTREIK